MLQEINLVAIERRARSTFFEDGLYDMMLGIAFLFMSFFLMDKRLVFLLCWPGLGPGIIEIIKRRVSYPRTGYVKFPSPVLMAIVVFLACVGGLALSMGASALVRAALGLPVSENWSETLFFGATVFLTGMICFLGYYLQANRWLGYGLATGLVLVAARALDEPLLVTAFAVAVTLTGLTVFLRFVHSKPVHVEAALNEQ